MSDDDHGSSRSTRPAPDDPLGSLTARIEGIRDWSRRLGSEIVEVPETLRRLREASVNFDLVGRRLAASSESLEEITALYESTIADTTRRSADAAGLLKSQVDAIARAGSPEQVMSLLRDVQRSVDVMAQLNPLWPRRAPRTDEDGLPDDPATEDLPTD